MQFGHFFYPMTSDASQDAQAIKDCLYEAELVEELGLDAIWLAEHHFAGEVAYGDPLVFASAVAVKTRRVMLGLGIVEMALHNPVRLAIQTALVDHLSNGRLVVGTGRGSNYNAFEYAGFGTTVAAGRERLAEAEDLLVKAWTTDNLEFQGEFWQVRFPSIRPRPYQKPHPPLARACLSDESIKEMARIGRPVLLRGRTLDSACQGMGLYRESMRAAGFDEDAVERAADQCWVWCDAYLAETDEQALDEFLPALERASKRVADVRVQWNREGEADLSPPPPLPRSAYAAHPDPSAREVLVGSPRRVAEQVALLRDGGAANLMLTHRGLMSREQATCSLKLLSEKVVPLFR